MAIPAARRRRGADRDVGAGAGGRVAGEQKNRRQPQRPEDEPDRRAEIAGDERREER
jgi:hypothetical protein